MPCGTLGVRLVVLQAQLQRLCSTQIAWHKKIPCTFRNVHVQRTFRMASAAGAHVELACAALTKSTCVGLVAHAGNTL